MDIFGTSGVSAPEFPNKLTWFNLPAGSDLVGLKIVDLRGRVILVDFWTYSCINCQRTLPYLQKWWEKYQDCGLVIIGVHSPEFDFEKQEENVKAALKKYGVDWPVVMDNDMEIWSSYANHYWPAKYLINHEGKIIYTHFGEGNYIETELKIQEALKETGFKVSDKVSGGSQSGSAGLEAGQTPELYFGSLRGSVQNIPQDISLKSDQIYSIGKWNQEPEFLQHARVTDDLDDLVILSYQAKDVYLVMSAEDEKPIKVYVTLDGIGLATENAGEDVQFDSEGRSFVEVKFATLYHIISSQTFGDHSLRLSTLSDKLRLFAATFGS